MAAARMLTAAGGGSSSQHQQQQPDVSWQKGEVYRQLSAAELLGDAEGYRRALGLLVALLARSSDTVRRGGVYK